MVIITPEVLQEDLKILSAMSTKRSWTTAVSGGLVCRTTRDIQRNLSCKGRNWRFQPGLCWLTMFWFWCYLFHDTFSHLSFLYFCSILRQHINVVIYRCTMIYLLQMFPWHTYWTTKHNFYFVICLISLLVCKVVKCSDCILFTHIFIHMVKRAGQMMTSNKNAVCVEE